MITFVFGSQETAFAPTSLWDITNSEHLLQRIYPQVNKSHDISHLIMLKQLHTTKGYAILSPEDMQRYQPYTHEGDYLITNQPHVALGVATADCLPIFLIDSHHRVIAAVHAGWKGTLQQIIVKALEHMQAASNTQPAHVTVIFGPHAKPCCYEVQPDLVSLFPEYPSAFIMRDKKIFFDNLKANTQQFLALGVQERNIITTYTQCTICNTRFCSVRRDQQKALRQCSWIALR